MERMRGAAVMEDGRRSHLPLKCTKKKKRMDTLAMEESLFLTSREEGVCLSTLSIRNGHTCYARPRTAGLPLFINLLAPSSPRYHPHSVNHSWLLCALHLPFYSNN